MALFISAPCNTNSMSFTSTSCTKSQIRFTLNSGPLSSGFEVSRRNSLLKISSPFFSTKTILVCVWAMTTFTVSFPFVARASAYNLSGASSFKETVTWSNISFARCKLSPTFTSFNTSNPYSDFPQTAPKAAAIGSPTIPVPGIPTPIPFLYILPLTSTSKRSGTPPNTSLHFAHAKAQATGSVHPKAGTASFLNISMICWSVTWFILFFLFHVER